MPRSCAVCTHIELAAINKRLLVGLVNVSELAREFGVPRKSMQNHRNCHVEQWYAALRERAALPGATAHQLEVNDLYNVILDGLATAEAGAWQHIERRNGKTPDGDKPAAPTLSLTSVAHSIRDVRAHVVELVELSLKHPNEEEAQARRESRELGERISEQLRRIDERKARSVQAGSEA
jgi:hypothetical protein